MKRYILLLLFLVITVSIFGYDFSSYPMRGQKGEPIYGQEQRYLPKQGYYLGRNHDITVRLYHDTSKLDYDMRERAKAYLLKVNPQGEKKTILFWTSSYQKKGVIVVSENIKGLIDEKYISVMEADVLNKLISKWYTEDSEVIGKILGGFRYILEKDILTKEQLKKIKYDFIKIDDPLYSLSLKQPFHDIMKLFYFEPITFIIYFPFVAYFIIVRGLGTMLPGRFRIFMEALWLSFMILIIMLVMNRMNILFPDYVGIFIFVSMLNIPIFIFLYWIFKSDVDYALNRYFYEIKGGFETANSFEGKTWEEK